jgi:hypothetical protein
MRPIGGSPTSLKVEVRIFLLKILKLVLVSLIMTSMGLAVGCPSTVDQDTTTAPPLGTPKQTPMEPSFGYRPPPGDELVMGGRDGSTPASPTPPLLALDAPPEQGVPPEPDPARLLPPSSSDGIFESSTQTMISTIESNARIIIAILFVVLVIISGIAAVREW